MESLRPAASWISAPSADFIDMKEQIGGILVNAHGTGLAKFFWPVPTAEKPDPERGRQEQRTASSCLLAIREPEAGNSESDPNNTQWAHVIGAASGQVHLDRRRWG